MHEYIQPKPLYEVLPIFADVLTLDVEEDRAELVRIINRYREHLYNFSEGSLFDDCFDCLKVHTYCLECLDGCSCDNSYRAVTLPDHVDGVQQVWVDKEPMRTYSRWREGRVGRQGRSYGTELSSMLHHKTFPTERQMKSVTRLSVFTHCKTDSDLLVIVNVRTADDEEKELHFTTVADTFVTVDEDVAEIISVVLPRGRLGTITLAQEDGYVLSDYSPLESVPHYRRLKIMSHCDTCQVLVQSSKKFVDICWDSDIVEIGSRLAIEAYARYEKFGIVGADPNERAIGNIEMAKFKDYVSTALKRRMGKAMQDGTPFYGRPNTRNKQLPGYGRNKHRNRKRYLGSVRRQRGNSSDCGDCGVY